MKNSALLMVLSVSCFGVLAAGCNDKQDTTPATQQMPAPTVNVMPVQLQTVPLQQEYSGRTVAYQKAEVRPQATGIIEQILFNEGGMVKENQPLYRLSIDNYESATIGNRAAVNQAKANVNTAIASLETANAQKASQLALLNQAKLDVERLYPLVAQQAISKQQYDQALTQYRTAQAAVVSTDAAIAQAQANIDSAKAAVASAEARLSASQIDLDRTIVTSPIAGVTERSSVTVGALVNANQPEPLVTISKINPIYVDISQSSAELLKLKQQQASGDIQQGDYSVVLKLEDGSTYPVRGRLILSEAKVDENTGAVTVRAAFDNSHYILFPGMYVTALVNQGTINDAVLLPQSALMRTPTGDAQVYVVDADNKVQIRPVTTTGTYDGKWVITDGLQAGESVVIVGGAKVKPEQQVQVQPYNDTPKDPNLPAPSAQAKGAQSPVTPQRSDAPSSQSSPNADVSE